MIVLEGDQPLGADAHHYYDGLVDKLSQDTKHVEHIQNFWGDPLTAAGSQSSDGKAALVQLYLAGNQGESLANESVDSVRNIVDRHTAAAGRQGLCHRRRAPGHRSVRGGPARHSENHPDHPRRDRGDAVLALPPSHHGVSRALHGDDRVDRVPRCRCRAGERRHHRVVDVFDQSADAAGHRRRNRLRDLPSRPFSRSASHRAGSGLGVQHDVPRNRAHHLGFGPDDCRRGAVSDVHPAALLPEPGRSRRYRRPGRSGGGADPGAGAAGHRPPFRPVRPRPPDAHPGLAAHRHGHRALARAHPGGDDRHRPHRSARPAEIQDELRRPALHARQCPGQCRLHRRRTPLLAGAAQSRTVDDRSRPRPAQFHRHDPAGARRQGGLPHRRHRSGAIDHPPAGHAPGPHVDTVPDQRGQRLADQQSALSAGPRRRPAQAGRT